MKQKKYIHKRTGKPYTIVTDGLMLKKDGVWISGLILYKAEYDNPDGEFFAREVNDFNENFEEYYDAVNLNDGL